MIQHDSQGFLVGTPLNFEKTALDVTAIRKDISAIKAVIVKPIRKPSVSRTVEAKGSINAQSRSIERIIEKSTRVVGARKEREKSKEATVSFKREKEKVTPKSTEARFQRIDRNVRAIQGSSSKTNKQEEKAAEVQKTEVEIARKREKRAQKEAAIGRRDAKGRFVKGDGSANSGAEGGSGFFTRLTDKIVGAVGGNEDLDPTIKAANEVMAPVKGALDMFTGENKETSWLKKIFKFIRLGKRDTDKTNREINKHLKKIEDKEFSSSGGGSGIWSILLAGVLGLVALLKNLKNIFKFLPKGVIPPMGVPRQSGGGGGVGTKGKDAKNRPGQPGKKKGFWGKAFDSFKGKAPKVGGLGLLGFALNNIGRMSNVYDSETSETMTRKEKDIETSKNVGGIAGSVAGGIAGAKAGGALGATVGSILGPVGTAVGGAVGAFLGGVGGMIFGDTVGEYLGELAGDSLEYIRSTWNSVSSWVGGAWDTASNWVSGAWDSVTTGVANAWNNTTELASAAWQFTTETVTNGFTAASDFITSAYTSATSYMSDKISSVATSVKDSFSTVSSVASSIWDWGVSSVKAASNAILGSSEKVITKVADKIDKIGDGTNAALGNITDYAYKAFGGLVKSMGIDFEAAQNAMVSTFKNLASKASSAWETVKGGISSYATKVLPESISSRISSFLGVGKLSSGLQKLQGEGAVSPIQGDYRISSEFGMRYHPKKKEWLPHRGVDIAAPNGTPIQSWKGGVVKYVGEEPDKDGDGKSDGYGRWIMIDHGDGTSTRYGHMDKQIVKAGQIVEAGQMIGTVGNTGTSTGNHLHFEVRVNGQEVNPMTFLKNNSTDVAKKELIPETSTIAKLPEYQPNSWTKPVSDAIQNTVKGVEGVKLPKNISSTANDLQLAPKAVLANPGETINQINVANQGVTVASDVSDRSVAHIITGGYYG